MFMHDYSEKFYYHCLFYVLSLVFVKLAVKFNEKLTCNTGFYCVL